MRYALKSAFFRFFRTKLYLWVLVISVVAGVLIALDTTNIYSLLHFRPRVITNEFLCFSILKIPVVLSVASAVFCTKFTGSDISYRTINNKISTGTRRIHIYIADYIVSETAVILSVLINLMVIFVFAKYAPIKSLIKVDGRVIGVIIQATVISIAFTAVYMVLQYFISTKMLAIIISLLIMPAMYMSTYSFKSVLNEPYRTAYTDEQTGEASWVLNRKYVGGTARKVVDYSYRSCLFYAFEEEDVDDRSAAVTSGAVFVLATAAGVAAINKKEYP